MALPGVAAARGPRLRLTRKKPPAPPSSSCSGPGGGGQEGRRPNSNRSWLDQEGLLNESDKLWRLLVLRSVNSGLNRTSQEMPDLPAFFDKNPRNDEDTQQPAIFKVGTEEFQWIPFPPAIPFVGGRVKNPDSSHFTKEKLPESEPTRVSQQSSGLAPRRASAGVKRPSELRDGRATEPRLPRHPQPSQLRKKQRLSEEGATFPSVPPQALSMGESCPGLSSLKKSSHSLGPEGASVERDTASATMSQGTGTLDSCPMCQVPFTGKLSQLDVDSHLAKCLSESIEDVIW
ncbi:Fanconi anemia core complex-associated protein 20 [Macrotis lagotis]|uniref:Fanconi anemia core complex-associated protein 20 n=1 Tax=Macrotis lagotis TaxID=92651 RepID=UPI003D69A752